MAGRRKGHAARTLAGGARAAQRASQPPQLSLERLFPPKLQREWEREAEDVQRQNIESAREAYVRRGLVLYLGAGVSCSIGLPTWWDLIQSLTVTMMTEQVGSALANLRKLTPERVPETKLKIQQQVLEGAAADKSILILARSIKKHFGPRLPHEVAQALYRPLFQSGADLLGVLTRAQQTSLEAYQPIRESGLFKALVQLARAQRDVRGVQAIVNLNYDDLIEEWMRHSGIRCDTILSGRRASRDTALPCYHVHGVLPFRRIHDMEVASALSIEQQEVALRKMRDSFIGNFVFSEDEYHTEYSDPYRWSNMTMINQLGRFSGLFVGLSLQDPNLRRLIDVTHRQYPDITNYAILTRNTARATGSSREATLQDLFERVETESFADFGVRVIWTNNYDEVPKRIFEICDIDKAVARAA